MMFSMMNAKKMDTGIVFCLFQKIKKQDLFELLNRARELTKHRNTIHYKNIGRKVNITNPVIKLLFVWIDILYYILQQQKCKAIINWGYGKYDVMHKILGAKLAIFRDIDHGNQEKKPMNYRNRVEATFRIGLKGALHYMFSNSKVIIDKIYVDYDHEHFHKTFNEDNLWVRLRPDLNRNIGYTCDSKVVPIGKKEYISDRINSQIMQLTDITVGAFRNVIRQDYDFYARYMATQRIRALLQRDRKNIARMRNSRFYKGYTLTNAYVLDDKWRYEDMIIPKDMMQIEIEL